MKKLSFYIIICLTILVVSTPRFNYDLKYTNINDAHQIIVVNNVIPDAGY